MASYTAYGPQYLIRGGVGGIGRGGTHYWNETERTSSVTVAALLQELHMGRIQYSQNVEIQELTLRRGGFVVVVVIVELHFFITLLLLLPLRLAS